MKTAFVLGGTNPHKSLIEKLKNRGYYTILIDYLEEPCAKKVADEHLIESTLDKERVAELAKERNAELIISSCVDQANVTCCYVGEKLNLPHPYSYQASIDATDKVRMKQILVANGIPTAKHYSIRSIDEFHPEELSFPIIVKPADSNSSKGVRKIDSLDEDTNHYIKRALEISRNGSAIIEEFKVGREIGVDCIIKNHKAHIIMTRERRKIESNNDQIQQIYGSFWPADISTQQKEKLRMIAEKIGLAFDIDNSPLMMQTIVNDEEVNVIEFGARIGGGENFYIIEELTGCDIINTSIQSFLGEELTWDYHEPSFYILDNYLYVRPEPFGDILYNGSENLIDKSNVYKPKGAVVGQDISSNNRVGSFIVKGKSTDELIKKLKTIISKMDIINLDGKSIMRKDLYNF